MRLAQAAAQQTGSSRYPSVQGQTGIETSRQQLNASNVPDAIRDSMPDD